jgi:hypothetical protein
MLWLADNSDALHQLACTNKWMLYDIVWQQGSAEVQQNKPALAATLRPGASLAASASRAGHAWACTAACMQFCDEVIENFCYNQVRNCTQNP